MKGFVLIATLLALSRSLPAAEIHLAQGLLAGEVTSTSVILRTRLAASPGLVDGDVPGTQGIARFEISSSPAFQTPDFSGWIPATAANDFIVKARIGSLQPGTTYHYRAIHGSSREQTKASPAATFRTLPAAGQSAPIRFVLTSCLNHAFFQHGDKTHPPALLEDRKLGYPALEPIMRLAPDFVILNGDCVYYDHPWDTRAKTQAELRKKWH